MTQDSEVTPSGQALKQAASWLGISDPAKVLDEDPAADAFQPRPEGLGLGAKFLPHHKAAQLTMPLEKRFKKRLQRATTDDADLVAAPLQKRGRPVGKYQAQDSDQQPGESSEEDEVGRSGAFGPKKSLQHQTHATAQHQQPQKRKKGKKRQAGSNQQQL